MLSPRLCVAKSLITRGFASVTRPNRVYWLASGDIFRNLAFEVCCYDNRKRYTIEEGSQKRPADILMWRSDPCVVIGRNQNVWLETSPREIEGRGWRLARRMSGGGAVFHDHGNLNITFLEARKYCDRWNCMEFLRRTLMKKWSHLNIFVGPRFDLWLLPESVLPTDLDHSKVREPYSSISLLIKVLIRFVWRSLCPCMRRAIRLSGFAIVCSCLKLKIRHWRLSLAISFSNLSPFGLFWISFWFSRTF